MQSYRTSVRLIEPRAFFSCESLESVIFTDTAGWYYEYFAEAGSVYDSASPRLCSVKDPETNARYFMHTNGMPNSGFFLV